MDWLVAFLEREVAVDLSDGFTVFGRLITVAPDHCEFADADLHNQQEANSSRDRYAAEVHEVGIRPNRRWVAIPRDRIIAVCPLEDLAP
jgi:hypothetical protein